MVDVRKWRWHGMGLTAGVLVAAGFAVAGQWRSGLAGAAVIGVGIFVAPELSTRLRERHVRKVDLLRADRAALARLDRGIRFSGGPPARQAGSSAAWWLRPDQRVVDFIDRQELAVLRDWCADDQACAVALLTGAGGVGKTRLALRLAEEQEKAGWLCRIVRPGRGSRCGGCGSLGRPWTDTPGGGLCRDPVRPGRSYCAPRPGTLVAGCGSCCWREARASGGHRQKSMPRRRCPAPC